MGARRSVLCKVSDFWWTKGGKLFIIFFAVLMNLVLFLYDFLIGKLTVLYKYKIHKKVRQLFK